jgi:O-antigen ligase
VILVLVAIAVGAIVPAISGLVQLWVGNTMDINGAPRLTGVYATSPVGLALGMQLAALALAAIALRRLPRRSAILWIGVVTFIVLTVVLDETASRLVFVSFILGLIGIEALDRRWLAIPVIVLGTVVALALQPDLANRIATTGRPSESATPNEFGQVPSETLPPDIETELEVHGDSSLRFRVYVWTVMLDEWAKSPIVGRGTGTFATILQARSGMERVAPHNDYLGILLENGVPGLVLYLGLQLAVLLALLRRFRGASPTERGVLAGVAACFVTLNIVNVINNAVLFLDLQVTIWVLVGATLGLSDEAADAPEQVIPGPPKPAVTEGAT